MSATICLVLLYPVSLCFDCLCGVHVNFFTMCFQFILTVHSVFRNCRSRIVLSGVFSLVFFFVASYCTSQHVLLWLVLLVSGELLIPQVSNFSPPLFVVSQHVRECSLCSLTHGFCRLVDGIGRAFNLLLNLYHTFMFFCFTRSHHHLLLDFNLPFLSGRPRARPSCFLFSLQQNGLALLLV